jgi:DNA-binding transcriptional MerR regulator
MAIVNKIPAYNLKVVIRDTGIKPDTLRAWERRYGLPQPQRTEGGHRLYSAYDIEMLKWLHSRQQEGLSISRAVELWKSLEEEGQDPLQAIPNTAPSTPAVNISGESLDELRMSWVESAEAFDEIAAEQALAMAFARYPVETVVMEVMQKGLSTIGDGWYEGKVTVQQEHFASALVLRRLDAMLAAAPLPTRNAKVLVLNPPDEEHTFSSLFLTLMLRLRGWGAIYLGPNVPLVEIDATIKAVKPNLVVLMAMRLQTAATLLQLSEGFLRNQIPIAYGGLIFKLAPTLNERFPGIFLGEQLYQSVDRIEQHLINRIKQAVTIVPDVRLRGLAEVYNENLPAIEAMVWQALGDDKTILGYLETANFFLQQDISASLYIGEIGLLSLQIEWLEGLLKNNHIPLSLLADYLKVYAQAVQQVLGEESAELSGWLINAAGRLV